MWCLVELHAARVYRVPVVMVAGSRSKSDRETMRPDEVNLVKTLFMVDLLHCELGGVKSLARTPSLTNTLSDSGVS